MTNKTVAFYTLGCKLNYSETSSIGRIFAANNYQTVSFEQGADVYVVNTCSVTDEADKKCKRVVKQALKHNPAAFVAIVGCYAQLKPKEISEIPGVSAVFGAAEKFNLVEHIEAAMESKSKVLMNGEIAHVNQFVAGWSMGDRTRSFLKVQDGCNYGCSFCTIPLARGRSRSGPIVDAVENAKSIAAQGVKEVVITGVNLGDFGLTGNEGNKNREHGTFLDLIQALDQVEEISRFRISSIEPNLLTNNAIDFVANSQRFVPHFHVPLQSGSDKILRLMRRRYLRNLYAERVAHIKSVTPHACIGVDVIVGFPGETHEDFLDTYNFLNELDISYLHVFTYSERPNTPAIDFANVVPGNVRAERSKMLHILSDKKRRFFYEQQLGKTFKVLFEHEQKASEMFGFTENYVKIKAKYDPALVNQIKTVVLDSIDADGLVLVREPKMELLQH